MKVFQLLGGLFFSLALSAQSIPQGISYQAVALDPNGHPVIGVDPTGQPIENAEINVRIAVLDGTPTGPVLYEEQHTVLTDQYGLFTLTIGDGLVASGAFNAIDWASDKKYLQTKLDLHRTGNFILAGVQQLMSVPYAFVAQSAIDKDDADSDPSNELQTLSRSNDTLYLTNGGFVVLPADQVNDGDANPTNELQNITLNNRDVTLSQNGGTFTIPVDPDSDSTNELQSLSINGQIISLSKGGSSVTLPPDQVDDADADPTNEIQFLMRSNDTVYLSGGGYVVLPEDQVDDADNDPVNELQSLSLNNRIVSLSQNGGSFSLPVDFDSDSTNELQSLSISGNTITLTQGGSIALPIDEVNDADSDPNNEIQILTRNQDTLFLSSGGYVVLPEDQVNDADSDPSNELQSLSISGGTISLSSGGSVTIFDGNYSNLTNTPFIPTTTTDLVNTSGFLTSEIDGSITNELQAISISNDTIFLSNGGFVKLPASQGFDGQYSSLSGAPTLPTKTSDLINDSGFLTTEVDGSTTNEIQTISKSGSTISLSSNGGSVTVFDGDYDNLTNAPLIPANTSDLNNDSGFLTHEIDSSITNEIQTISISNDTIFLSNGGFIVLPSSGLNYQLIGSVVIDQIVCGGWGTVVCSNTNFNNFYTFTVPQNEIWKIQSIFWDNSTTYGCLNPKIYLNGSYIGRASDTYNEIILSQGDSIAISGHDSRTNSSCPGNTELLGHVLINGQKLGTGSSVQNSSNSNLIYSIDGF